MKQTGLFVAGFVLLCAGAGCSSILENAGSSLTGGAMDAVIVRSDTLIEKVGGSAGVQIARIRDTVTGPAAREALGALREEVIGAPARKNAAALRDELIGPNTTGRLVTMRDAVLDRALQDYLASTAAMIGPGLLNDSTRRALAAVRDTLIGSRSNLLIKAIVDTALETLHAKLTNEIYPGMRTNLGFVEQNAASLIVVTGIVSLVICWFVWTQKEKYARIARMLTFQISAFPDGPVKESFKSNISQNAKQAGIESDLRKLLDSQGLLHAKGA